MSWFSFSILRNYIYVHIKRVIACGKVFICHNTNCSLDVNNVLGVRHLPKTVLWSLSWMKICENKLFTWTLSRYHKLSDSSIMEIQVWFNMNSIRGFVLHSFIIYQNVARRLFSLQTAGYMKFSYKLMTTIHLSQLLTLEMMWLGKFSL